MAESDADLIDRLVYGLARAEGLEPAVVRLAYGIPQTEESPWPLSR